jgi:hypothetical protein
VSFNISKCFSKLSSSWRARWLNLRRIEIVIQGPAEIPDDLVTQFEWIRWRGEFFIERPSSEAQRISFAMERWSVEHRVFVVDTYLKNNDSVVTQRIFRRHFSIHRNDCH